MVEAAPRQVVGGLDVPTAGRVFFRGDEPTGALDAATGVVVLEAIERVRRELDTTVALITHNAVIADMADRVVLHPSDRVGDGVRLAARDEG